MEIVQIAGTIGVVYLLAGVATAELTRRLQDEHEITTRDYWIIVASWWWMVALALIAVVRALMSNTED